MNTDWKDRLNWKISSIQDAIRTIPPGRRILIGSGADAFAAQADLEQVDPSFFFTESRWQSLVKQLKEEVRPVPSRPAGAPPPPPPVPSARASVPWIPSSASSS